MGAEIFYEDETSIITNTICHHGTKPKLYFYKDSQSFHCYTECGQMDIVGLVCKHFDIDDSEIYKAINWICSQLNISNGIAFGEGKQEKQISDWEFINSYKYRHKEKKHLDEFKVFDEKVLKIFQSIYMDDWKNDGISEDTMKKYNILYSICQQKIIIPHYDINNNLIGIRTRAMLDEDIEFAKYSPLKLGDEWFNHKLGSNLYGLNKNINAIQKKKKIMLVEAEKSVLQTDSMFGEDNFTVAICGSNLSSHQKDMILSLGVQEVIIALDKQFKTIGDDEHNKWVEHIKKGFILPLIPYVNVTIIWDNNNILPYKASPTDLGKEKLLKLMDDKIPVGMF